MKWKGLFIYFSTWSGPWCSTMDISDVFITMLSLLDSNPISHEPGYENFKDKSTQLYNTVIEYNNINSLIISQTRNIITNKDNEFYYFKDIIINHIKNNYDKLLKKIESLINKTKFKNNTIIKVGLYNINIVINYNNLKKKFEQLNNILK